MSVPGRARLFGESPQLFGVGRQVRQQDLDGDVPTEAFVLRPPDLAGAADAELPDDRVDADAPAGLQVEPVGGKRLREAVNRRSRQEIPGCRLLALSSDSASARSAAFEPQARAMNAACSPSGNLPCLGEDAIQFFPLRAHGDSLSAASDR